MAEVEVDPATDASETSASSLTGRAEVKLLPGSPAEGPMITGASS
jgi:hypothetical protein